MNAAFNRTVYPVSLMLSGRPCLVVGGGKVAARKVGGLLDAEADVTVVSPDLDPRLADWVREGRVRHVARVFEAGDVNDTFQIVYAATGNKRVNRDVLMACQAHRVLCCPVDGHWISGDFMTPATFRRGLLTVAVSTGGQDCRRSRLIKENLAHHIDLVDTADCCVIGTSHQCLDLAHRERLHQDAAGRRHLARLLRNVRGLHEFMLLSTCNRMELIAIKTCEHSRRNSDLTDTLIHLLGFQDLDPTQYYVKRGFDAFEHVALLAAGLLSQMPGENHIVAQLKESIEEARSNGWANGMTDEWIAAALHISKDIRGLAPDGWAQGDIEDACGEFLATHRPTSAPPRAIILGTGAIGRGMAQRLTDAGWSCDWVWHRSCPTDVPDGARLVPWDQWEPLLDHTDAVIAAVTSPKPVITTEQTSRLSHRPTLLLDLATPRAIQPDIEKTIPQASLWDQDRLLAWHSKHRGVIEPVLLLGRETIREHKAMYDALIHTFQDRNPSQ